MVITMFLVAYKAMLVDGSIVAETPEEGIEFYVKDGKLWEFKSFLVPKLV